MVVVPKSAVGRLLGAARGLVSAWRSGEEPAVNWRRIGHAVAVASVDRKQLQTLASCHFIEHGENIVLLGPTGVGKTHLAVGLGLQAIWSGSRVLCATAAGMIGTLTKALAEGRLDELGIGVNLQPLNQAA